MSWKMQDRRGSREDRRAVGRMLVHHVRFLQSIINGVSDPVVVVGTDRRVKFINQAARDFSGIEGESGGFPENAHCHQILFRSEQSCDCLGRQCPLLEVLEIGKPVTVAQDIPVGTGELRYYEMTASPLWGDGEELLGVVEILRDVTERCKASEALRESRHELELRVETRTRELQEANESLRREVEERKWTEDQLSQSLDLADLVYRVIPSAIFTVDLNRIITSWNNKAESVTGFTAAEVLGKTCETFALDPCTRGCGVFSDRLPKPIVGRICKIRTRDGRVRVVAKNADLLKDVTGRVIGAVESFEDITVQQDVDRQLRTERDKFRGILSALDHGMHIVNRDFVIEFQNTILRDTFGDKVGEKCYQVYKHRDSPCDVCRMQIAIEEGKVQRTEEVMVDNRHYEQSYVPFTDVDGEAKVLILLRDVTEEKMYRAETMRAGQLASIGELAAGVAHEINNPINGIINYAQILQDDIGAQTPESEVLGRIVKEGERIAHIVRNLLYFARQRDEEEEIVAVAAVIADSLALVQHHLQKDGVTIVVDVPEDLPPIKVNSQQLQQVFLNLLSNARHALNQRYPGRDPGKKIEIHCREERIGEKRYVRTSVTDFGTGIPPAIRESIFEPFFSSKKPGEGTGLGLSISRSLVRDFHGFLDVETEENSFTTMIVDLPVYEA